MKLSFSTLIAVGSVLIARTSAQVSTIEAYPDPNGLAVAGYSRGDNIPIECIQRNTDCLASTSLMKPVTLFMQPSPNSFETDKPLSLKYNVDEVLNCTIDLGHDFFHVFQLLIHEDVPFSCRIPYAKRVIEQ